MANKPNTDPLTSSDTLTLARALSDIQIDIIRKDEGSGGAEIAGRLEKLRAAVWQDTPKASRKKPITPEQQQVQAVEEAKKDAEKSAAQKQVFEEVIEGLNEKQKEQLLGSYAKMGHLYDIAALSARTNFINEIKKEATKSPGKNKPVPGSAEEVIAEFNKKSETKKEKTKTTAELVEQFNKPVFEVVMTAHPTNVNSLESMQAQREINKALSSISEGAGTGKVGAIGEQLLEPENTKKLITKAIEQYQKAPLLLTDEKNTPKNLTVRDETNIALYFLGNIYDDLPKTYKNYDDALNNQATSENPYDPTTLNLQMRFGSWASGGDKDGNKNVTAETTLEAIALHTQAIVSKYNENLGELKDKNLAEKWQKTFSEALKEINPLVEQIGKLRKDAKSFTDLQDKNFAFHDDTGKRLSEEFDELSGKLSAVRKTLNGKEFESVLKKAAEGDKTAKKDPDPEALNMLRRFRTFGFNFSKIEYRETAKEYGRVVNELIDGYKDLSPEQKVEKLTELLHKPGNEAAELLANKEAAIIEDGAGKAYSEKSAAPIAYHTLKRMALARDFGDMIKDNVLAECGQPDNKTKPTEANITNQGIANILEAQFLQRAVEKNGKRPAMGIVPLFEEPDTMSHIDKIVGGVLRNKAYEQHLEHVAANDNNHTQQVMIAHSDNARRSGLQAARAYIHEAHKKIYKLADEINTERKTQGKKEIGVQFFEGGSISDAYRNGVRAISSSVNAFGLYNFAKFTFQGGDLLNYFNHPDSTARLIDRQISQQAYHLDDVGNKIKELVRSDLVDSVAVQALKSTLTHYQTHDFTQENMGSLLGALKYNDTVLYSNAGSRAGARKAANDDNFAIPIDSVRTIGFSKAWQGSGINPSWIGLKELKHKLTKFVREKYNTLLDGNAANDEKYSDAAVYDLMHNLTPKGDGKQNLTEQDFPLAANQIKYIYDKSPTFLDAQDRSTFALAMTDMNAAGKIANSGLAETANDSEIVKKQKESGKGYLNRVKSTYEEAAKTAYAARTGNDLKIPDFQNEELTNHYIRRQMLNSLPMLKEDIEHKTDYRSFLLHLQSDHQEMFKENSFLLGRTIQSAKDTVEHGRWLGASDPAIARERWARNNPTVSRAA